LLSIYITLITETIYSMGHINKIGMNKPLKPVKLSIVLSRLNKDNGQDRLGGLSSRLEITEESIT
jgi:hypothetical protein